MAQAALAQPGRQRRATASAGAVHMVQHQEALHPGARHQQRAVGARPLGRRLARADIRDAHGAADHDPRADRFRCAMTASEIAPPVLSK